MWERTITVGSAGKTFGVTGWRVGWLIGDRSLIKSILAIQARTVFTTPTPLQAPMSFPLMVLELCRKQLQVALKLQRRMDISTNSDWI
jgi:aspartate/methionine/tyrosine aminotransferase